MHFYFYKYENKKNLHKNNNLKIKMKTFNNMKIFFITLYLMIYHSQAIKVKPFITKNNFFASSLTSMFYYL